ncbi:MAG: SGNH/GDSL hydrolase family protein [Bacteroidota bacterium]
MQRQTYFKIITLTIAIAFGCLLAEIGYRIFHYLTFHNLEEISSDSRPAVNEPETEKKMGQVIQLSSNPKIIYEFIPNSIYKFKNVMVSINEDGFRDKNYPSPKGTRTKRVIGLGDSVMFGWGVEEEDAYLSQLENNLNDSDTLKYEVINTAVPGYNTVMELATFKNKIKVDEVDLVIINFVGNDYDLPNFIRKRPDYLGIKKSMILQLFEKTDGFDKRLRYAPFDDVNRRMERNPEKVPAEYRDMIGEAACINALTELSQLASQNDFRIIFLNHSAVLDVPPNMADFIKNDSSYILLELKPYWNEYQKQNPEAEWKLSEDDWHPSVEYHHLIGKVLEKVITEKLD